MSTYGLVTILGVINHIDGFFGDDKEVDRCLWVDVIKCEHFVVFEDNLGRNLLVNDLLEDRGALGRGGSWTRTAGESARLCQQDGPSHLPPCYLGLHQEHQRKHASEMCGCLE